MGVLSSSLARALLAQRPRDAAVDLAANTVHKGRAMVHGFRRRGETIKIRLVPSLSTTTPSPGLALHLPFNMNASFTHKPHVALPSLLV